MKAAPNICQDCGKVIPYGTAAWGGRGVCGPCRSRRAYVAAKKLAKDTGRTFGSKTHGKAL